MQGSSMSELYLSKDQIRALVKQVGQPRASVLIHEFFNAYRHCLESSDVAGIYDQEYREKIAAHETHEIVGGEYKINVFNHHSFDYLRSRLSPSARVLDVGCGDGQFALAVAASGARRVLGLDFDGEAVARAREAAARSGLPCEFREEDVGKLSAEEPFDFVVLNDVTEHLSDRELRRLLTEIRDVLEDGGELIIHTPNGFALCNGTDADWLVRSYRFYLRIRARWRGFERTVEQLYYDQVHINIKSYRQLRSLLRDCGFESRVIYDDAHLPRWKRRLSSNMLVAATARRESRGRA
jgi:2-polyprenyl-3-methyl-5-hydroxy-6-metoxy-1,4-benzoquinol methylase